MCLVRRIDCYQQNPQQSCCIADSLIKLPELVLEVVLRMSRFIVLGDFNIHAETDSSWLQFFRDLLASTSTMELSHTMTGLTHEAGHMLDITFCICLDTGALIIWDGVKKSLSWSGHYLIKQRFSKGVPQHTSVPQE